MRIIKSINEVSGVLMNNTSNEFFDRILKDTFDKLSGLIKYKYYANYKSTNRVQEIYIILTLKKEYELIYALSNELNILENAIKSALGQLVPYYIEILLLYK